MWFAFNPGKVAFCSTLFGKCVFWLAEVFETLHFPTTDVVTLSNRLADFLELVSFVAYKQAEFFTK